MQSPPPWPRLPPRPLLLGALAVAVFRGLLCWQSPDLLHPVDPAELDLLWLTEAWHDGGLQAGELVRHLGAAASVHHGGTLPVSLLILALSAVLGPGYVAVKAAALAASTLTWLLWTHLAGRLGGGRAALLAGIALALPVPWATQWWLTAWGSHPEASVLTAAWLLAWSAPAGALGLLLGLGLAWSPLLWPTGLALGLAALRVRGRVAFAPLLGGALVAWLPLQLGALSTPWPWLRAPLTEDPTQTLPALLGRALDPQLLLATATTHLPLPLVASQATSWAPLLSAALGLALLAAGGLLLRRGPSLARLVVLLPLLHLVALLLLSPFRPALQHRYLLPWLPALLLWPALVAASAGLGRAWALPALLPSLASLPVVLPLLLRDAPADLGDMHPRAYLALGLDRVSLEQLPEVERYLATRGTRASPAFSAGWTRRWAYPVLGEDFPPARVRGGLRARLLELSRELGLPADRLAFDAGWGLGVLTDWDPPACLDAVALLQELRQPALRGLAAGLEDQPRAADFVAAVRLRDPAAAALLEGGS